MLRESHRRRASPQRIRSARLGHRAVYLGAVVTTAAAVAGFGAALVVYGPLGTPARQLSGTSIGIPPKGVFLGNAQELLASDLNLTGAGGWPSWNWTNASGNFTGPCNESGILNSTSGGYLYSDNATAAYNISSIGGNVTLVCLNSVTDGVLNATWYWNGTANTTVNSYNSSDLIPDGSYDNTPLGNVSSCNQWNTSSPTGLDAWNTTHEVRNASFSPCLTYYEMNGNTTWVPSFGGQWNGTAYLNSTLWAPREMGYGPNDVVYELPVVFTNASYNGTYQISLAIQGATPVAQTFFLNDSIGGTGVAPDTVLFTFDMTAAWLFDTTILINSTGHAAPTNVSLIYGAIGAGSIVVTELPPGSTGDGFIVPIGFFVPLARADV